jgi:hypothetical protein
VIAIYYCTPLPTITNTTITKTVFLLPCCNTGCKQPPPPSKNTPITERLVQALSCLSDAHPGAQKAAEKKTAVPKAAKKKSNRRSPIPRSRGADSRSGRDASTASLEPSAVPERRSTRARRPSARSHFAEAVVETNAGEASPPPGETGRESTKWGAKRARGKAPVSARGESEDLAANGGAEGGRKGLAKRASKRRRPALETEALPEAQVPFDEGFLLATATEAGDGTLSLDEKDGKLRGEGGEKAETGKVTSKRARQAPGAEEVVEIQAGRRQTTRGKPGEEAVAVPVGKGAAQRASLTDDAGYSDGGDKPAAVARKAPGAAKGKGPPKKANLSDDAEVNDHGGKPGCGGPTKRPRAGAKQPGMWADAPGATKADSIDEVSEDGTMPTKHGKSKRARNNMSTNVAVADGPAQGKGPEGKTLAEEGLGGGLGKTAGVRGRKGAGKGMTKEEQPAEVGMVEDPEKEPSLKPQKVGRRRARTEPEGKEQSDLEAPVRKWVSRGKAGEAVRKPQREIVAGSPAPRGEEPEEGAEGVLLDTYGMAKGSKTVPKSRSTGKSSEAANLSQSLSQVGLLPRFAEQACSLRLSPVHSLSACHMLLKSPAACRGACLGLMRSRSIRIRREDAET